jgi:hypothetical protein
MCHIELERGETTTKTQYNGGFKLIVKTEFEIPEGTWRDFFQMTEGFGHDSCHFHQILNGHGPNSTFVFDSGLIIDGFDAYSEQKQQEITA